MLYPDPSNGEAGGVASGTPNASDTVTYAYDALGEQIVMQDRDGNTHDYTYDSLGRLISDQIPTGGFGSVTDQTVAQLGYTFNSQGLPDVQTSYGPSGNIVNQVTDFYNGLGQLTSEYQADTGTVTMSSPEVQYVYSSPATGSRLTEMIYPNGRILHYGYNNDPLDNAIDRVDYEADDNGSGDAGQQLEQYSYLGLSTIVSQDRPQVSVALTYLQQVNDASVNTAGGDQYTGLDQYGRVIDQNWIDLVTAGGNVDRFQYGYDADGNVLYDNNLLFPDYSKLYHSNSTATGDNNSAYDPLNRLVSYQQGILSSSGNNGATLDTVANPSATINYGLNALGDQTATTTSTTTNGTTTTTNESNSINNQNQETAHNGSGLNYDYDGNTLVDQNGTVYTYDAWNRMATATPTNSIVQEAYTYNAVGERVTQTNRSVAPVFLIINDGSAEQSMITSISLYFEKRLSTSTIANLVNDVTLTLQGVGNISFNPTVNNYSGDGQTFSFTFINTGDSNDSNSLKDGAYTLTVNGSAITFYDNTTMAGATTAQTTFTFYREFGDFFGEGRVSGDDFTLMTTYFNDYLPTNYWYLDPRATRLDNGTTFSALAQNYNDAAACADTGNILRGPFTAVFDPSDNYVVGVSSVSTSNEQTFYYSNQWQLIQENLQNTPSATPQMADQYVWGQAYVNELVLRDSNTVLYPRLYAVQDANWNVTSLVADASDGALERFTYDPYGNVTPLNFNPGGLIYSPNWLYLFQGGRLDTGTGLYNFQHRDYSPNLGTWVEEDPATYVNGLNMYQFEQLTPAGETDPSGLYINLPWDQGNPWLNWPFNNGLDYNVGGTEFGFDVINSMAAERLRQDAADSAEHQANSQLPCPCICGGKSHKISLWPGNNAESTWGDGLELFFAIGTLHSHWVGSGEATCDNGTWTYSGNVYVTIWDSWHFSSFGLNARTFNWYLPPVEVSFGGIKTCK